MYVGGDESIWGVGYRNQGSGDNCRLRRIETPAECRNYKKVVQGKFHRVILTQDGRVFFNGQNRKYMFRSSMSRDDHLHHFFEVTDYFRLDEGDKIVDITTGSHSTTVVTERG